MDLTGKTFVVADAECLRDVRPPLNFKDAAYLGNAVTCTVDQNNTYKDWVGNESVLHLWRYLCTFDYVVTYNGISFDYPLWSGCMFPPENIEQRHFFEKTLANKTIDLARVFTSSLKSRVRLNDVSVPTLGDAKEMEGGFAPQHWRAGRCLEVIEYCRGDVRRTKELFVLACEGKPLKIKTKEGDIREFKCNVKISK